MSTGVTSDPDLHLLVDGRRVDGVRRDGVCMFRIDLPAREVRLMSRAERPQDAGIGPDTRLLGYGVTLLRLEQGGTRLDLPVDNPDLVEGFHDCENGFLRWTNGSAMLPETLFAGAAGPVELGVGGFALPAYRLRARTDEAAAELVLGFESLGEDCEFGLVQRHFNAEPTGLLRWGRTDLPRLVRGLSCAFDGLGDPEHTRLGWSDDAGEYKLTDDRYLTAHTWWGDRVAEPSAEAALLRSGCARLRLLRRKLMADIATPRRIFVYKDSFGFSPAELRRLHAALRAIGPASLLCVQPGATGPDVGRVDVAGEGFYIGHIDRFVLADGPYDVWHALCAATRDLCRADGPINSSRAG